MKSGFVCRVLLFAMLLLVSCSSENLGLEKEVTKQAAKALDAEQVFREASSRLEELRDSLQINITNSIDLGMKPHIAKSTENARLEMQKTVLVAAKKNLELQQEYLILLKKQLQDAR
jgi:hypothetical protein